MKNPRMFFLNMLAASLVTYSAALPVAASTQHIALRDGTPAAVPAGALGYLNIAKASIGGPADAKQLIQAAISARYFGGDRRPPWTAADLNKSSFYCIIHVVHWKDLASGSSTQTVDAQNWYVYNGAGTWAQDDFATNKRIFGAKNVALLYIHLNRATSYSVEYDIDATSKIPANQLHLFEAASAFLPTNLANERTAQPDKDIFGITDANISYVPSDLSVTANYSSSAGTVTPLGDSVVFDNEGKYYWDVSVAVPITKMGQLQFNNTSNTVTASNVDKRTVFSVLDLYPFPKDVKNPGFDLRPYALAGVSVASQPLHRILLAAGWGPRYAQFYAGVIFTKQDSLTGLQAGSAATPAQTSAATSMKYSPAFSFGINLTVRDVFQSATTSSK